MTNIAAMLERYNQLLQAALAQNPRAANESSEAKSEEAAPVPEAPATAPSGAEDSGVTPPPEKASPQKQPTSPLLRRPKLDPVEMAELEKSAVELLRQSSSVQIQAKKAGTPAGEAKSTPLTTASATASKKKDKDKAPTSEQLDSLSLPPLLLVQLKIIKSEARTLGKTLDEIHDWIALNIPQMKEEDNVGVAVMAGVIQELAGSIVKVRGVYDLEASYVSDRAELDVKYLKTTDAESTLQAIEVCDADTWDTLEKGWRAMMRVSLMVHSTLAKNMRLLKDPRSAPKHNLHL
ncbi:proteasome activator PA28 beta subunit family protein, putative [Bodo saltans]|uniref:Proteasome activator PA28 beta subunit family protein, putative n=1 Tax=Bodo saltans TaxID=75058 RepID=A0A0S4J217_BODSA|nr:proteasome activator PA28 beta subunit family protein, putative [Bodo saltans]|eukprot:CUG83935.1 proteasome activator PA28 beta subunit family protein, putative [Bodo saltans]